MVSNRKRKYEEYLKEDGLEYIKMQVDSSAEILEVAKRVIKSGRTKYVEYNEAELVYEKYPTKLGQLHTKIKNGDKKVISELYYKLNKGTYPNKPFQGMLLERIDKPEKPRMIKIPAVTDRIVYTLLLERIEPLFLTDVERYPIYGLKGKGVSRALKDIIPFIKSESVILKLDFQGYFDTIPRAVLLKKIAKYNVGVEELKIIRTAINAPTNVPSKPVELASKHAHKFKPYEIKIGLPQGCAFSPLLASIYALDVEKFLINEGVTSVRYIDDIIIITESFEQARNIFKKVERISLGLSLMVHQPIEGEVNDKSYIAKADTALRFLGLDIVNGKATLPEEKKERFYKVLQERMLEKVLSEEDTEYRNNRIGSFIRGWTRYYREHADDWNMHMADIEKEGSMIIQRSELNNTEKSLFTLLLLTECNK